MLTAAYTLTLLAATVTLQGAGAQGIESCPGYTATNVARTDGRITADLALAGDACNAYSDDLRDLRLLVEYQAQQRLHIKIYDADEQVYQIPEDVRWRPGNETIAESDSALKFELTENPFSFTVLRNATGEVLFDTTGQALVFETQYLRLRTSLPQDPNIYGLGENSDSLRLPTTNYFHPFWNAGASFLPSGNLYGTFNAYYDHRGGNGTHAVYLLNSNGMRVDIDADDQGQYLEYNAIGGVFDFYIVSGATPRDASAQFADVVGHSALMPYWSFGYHHCRYGLIDIFEAAEIVANYSAADIPLETMWTDIEHMDYKKTFTLDPDRWSLTKVQEYVDFLHSHQQKSVFIIEPAIPTQPYPAYEDLLAQGAYFQYPNGTAVPGVVWGGSSIYPDWFNPSSQEYWNSQFSRFFNADDGIDIDGLWIDMNEAANFCNPVCMNATLDGIQQRRPERMPPARISAPFETPGWPEDWQPTCVTYVTFNVRAVVDGNKEQLLLLGNAVSLGNSTAGKAPALFPYDTTDPPTFNLTVQLPADTEVTYQYPRYAAGIDGTYIFEAENRTIRTDACNTMWNPQQVFDNITTTGTNATKPIGGNGMLAPEEGPGPDVPAGSKLGLPGRNLGYPQYNIGNIVGALSDQSLPTNVYHSGGYAEYDTHNLYGAMMGSVSRKAMIARRPTKRPMVISRSTYMGSSREIGHWFGDNSAEWRDYGIAIRQMASFAAFFQFPMVGSDTCGHNGNVTVELCARWAMLGAFNPFFRNHKVVGAQPQEFYLWPEVADAARKAINRRLTLLDYLYTAMYRQHQFGTPTISPVFFNYPNDTNTFGIETQFFFGDDILVTPVMEEGSTSVTAYIPDDVFYDFESYEQLRGNGGNVTFDDVPLNKIPTHIKGGAIIPMRIQPANTTTEVRKKNFKVVIAPGMDGAAEGYLYLDDGEALEPGDQMSYITFAYGNGSLSTTGTFGYQTDIVVEEVVLLGEGGAQTKQLNASLMEPFEVDVASA